jgi:3-isopropylmalate dehydratase
MRFSNLVLLLQAASVSVAAFVPASRSPAFQTPTSTTTSLSKLDAARTLYDKIWDDHLVSDDGSSSLIYIDRHLVHEVTSPQAFEGLRLASRGVRRPDCTITCHRRSQRPHHRS